MRFARLAQPARYFLSVLLVFSAASASADPVPPCMRGNQDLPQNDQQILGWKTTTKSGFLDRGHIQGILVKAFPDRSGHDHFAVQIGPNPQTDLIEVIYNQEFGAIPDTRPGLHVEACGDYITSNERNGNFPPSPVGAILHWVHYSPAKGQNPTSNAHDHGYLMIEGKLFGFPLPGQTVPPDFGKRRH